MRTCLRVRSASDREVTIRQGIDRREDVDSVPERQRSEIVGFEVGALRIIALELPDRCGDAKGTEQNEGREAQGAQDELQPSPRPTLLRDRPG